MYGRCVMEEVRLRVCLWLWFSLEERRGWVEWDLNGNEIWRTG
jgi:hypothetical protein